MAIKFRNEEHENRFYKILARMNSGDVYHTSVAYLLALDSDCYNHIGSLFDFSENLIKPNGALTQAWQTGTSSKTTRLMFNLWCLLPFDAARPCAALGQLHQHPCWCSIGEDYDSELNVIKDSARKYTVDEIFSSSLAVWYFEAVKLRYPKGGCDMPTFAERLNKQNRILAEKQKQLDKLNKTIETARENIKLITREIGEIKDEITALETRILTEAISQRGISVAELAAAIETGTFIPEKPPDIPENKNGAESSTDNTLTEKEVTDEVSGSGKALGGS